jgi:hypothetical protein
MRCSGVATAIAIATLATLSLGVAACQDPPLECVQDLSATCQPLYPPTFDNVFQDTLLPKCSTGGGSCHTPTGHQGGLVFDRADPDGAYHELMMNSAVQTDRERIAPGDPSCSVVIERLYATASRWHMPRGSTLAPEEKCAIVQWVQQGALRAPASSSP